MRAAVLLFLAALPLAAQRTEAPMLIRKTEPAYTEEARQAKVEGMVVVYLEVGTDGTARNLRVVRGLGHGLDENALECVKQWRFRPATRDGEPYPVPATAEVNFRLDRK